MCGIVGTFRRGTPVDVDVLNRMRDTLMHRGPDDAGTWISPDGTIGLAHRRLSVIDLSPGSRQPMVDGTGQTAIVFNGEMYNFIELRQELHAKGHTFRTQSDTEVILAAYREWGDECLTRLQGMFSFCICDIEKRRLFVARDRAGEKPLFYYRSPGSIVFASELKAIMADPVFPRKLDMEGLNYYLMYGYIPGWKSILSDVRKLPAGHKMVYDVQNDVLSIDRYWKLPEADGCAPCSADELADELEALLEDAVKHQLIADVPLGVLLSGGIDSSIVTAIASRVSSKPVKTFTITFPGHKKYDESRYARLVGAHFGTDHTELAAETANIELLSDLARQYDEPLADSSMVPTYLVSRLIRRHATVALGGDGGDELFGGYFHYSWIQLQEKARLILPLVLREGLACLGRRCVPLGFKGRTYIIGLGGCIMNSVAHVNVFFDHHVRLKLLSTAAKGFDGSFPAAENYRTELAIPGNSAIQKAMAMDFLTYLADDILVKVDRASMLSSLEIRAPFLDHRIIEFAFRKVPDYLKVRGKQRKILLRHLAERLLPEELDLNRKQGFAIPLSQWLKGPWGAYFEEVLRDLPEELFNRRFVAELIERQKRGYSNTQRLFALLIFELWRKHYRVALP